MVTQSGDSMHRWQAAQLDAQISCLLAFTRVTKSPRPLTLSPAPEHVHGAGMPLQGYHQLWPATRQRASDGAGSPVTLQLSAVLGLEHECPHLLRVMLYCNAALAQNAFRTSMIVYRAALLLPTAGSSARQPAREHTDSQTQLKASTTRLPELYKQAEEVHGGTSRLPVSPLG